MYDQCQMELEFKFDKPPWKIKIKENGILGSFQLHVVYNLLNPESSTLTALPTITT